MSSTIKPGSSRYPGSWGDFWDSFDAAFYVFFYMRILLFLLFSFFFLLFFLFFCLKNCVSNFEDSCDSRDFNHYRPNRNRWWDLSLLNGSFRIPSIAVGHSYRVFSKNFKDLKAIGRIGWPQGWSNDCVQDRWSQWCLYDTGDEGRIGGNIRRQRISFWFRWYFCRSSVS